MATTKRLGLVLAMAVGTAHAALPDAAAVPHLDEQGEAGYQAFLGAEPHRAFVIAPGGTWAWRAEMPSEDAALDAALQDCRKLTSQRCFAYAVDDRLVFDAHAWALSWGPYLGRAEAARAPRGVGRGQRFPDLVFRGPDGKTQKLSELRGQVVFLHFWGSWCPPCQREMPALSKLYAKLGDMRDVRFVFLPMREPVAEAQDWLRQKSITVPLYDPGEANRTDGTLRLADGRTLRDRELARVFPTTYVLDKHGVVVFSHTGPIPDWTEYIPFLKDVAARSGH